MGSVDEVSGCGLQFDVHPLPAKGDRPLDHLRMCFPPQDAPIELLIRFNEFSMVKSTDEKLVGLPRALAAGVAEELAGKLRGAQAFEFNVN